MYTKNQPKKHTQEDFNQTIEQINTLRVFFQALQEYGQAIPSQYNMTSKEMDEYLNNPDHFSREEQDFLNQKQIEMDSFVKDMISILRVKDIVPKKPKENWIHIN